MTESTPALGGGHAWLNWAVGVAFAVLVFTLQTGYAITNPGVAKDLGLTIAEVGFVGTMYTWVFALAQCASGSILDRVGARRILPVACLIVSAAAFLFAHATGPVSLVCANILAAIGASFGFIGAGFVGGQWFGPLKYGLMFALVQFVASMSAIAGQRVLGGLIDTTSWTTLIQGLGFGGLGVAALMFVFLRDRVSLPASWPGIRAFVHELADSLGKVLGVRDTWINALIGGATMGTVLGLGVVWGPRLLVAGGMDQGEAFKVSSLAWAGLACGSPMFAWISELLKSRVRAMAGGCVVQIAMLLLIMFRADASPTEVSVWFFLFGLMAGGSMLSFTVGAELASPALIGTSAAVVNATQFIVGGIMMAVPGRVLSGTGIIARIHESVEESTGTPTGTLSDYHWAIAIMPVALGFALLLCLFLKETHPARATASD